MGRSFGRGSPRFQGIRFRLGVAMALALLPIFILSIIQTQDHFRVQAEERRRDLELAVDGRGVDRNFRMRLRHRGDAFRDRKSVV